MITKKTKTKIKKNIFTLPSAPPTPPVNVAFPNTIQEKMLAITSLARAMEQLALAINGTNIKVTISNNSVHTVAGTAINLQTAPFVP